MFFVFSLFLLLLGFPVTMSLKVPNSLSSTLSHALSHTNTISKMDTRYTFTSTIKDYDNNKKQEILNVITPDGKTVETKKPYKAQFTVKTPKGPYER